MQEQDYELFENYLSKVLDAEAVLDFEERLKTDVAFNNSFKTYKEVNAFLENKFANELEDHAFKENVGTISDSYFKTNGKENSINNTTKVQRIKPWYYGMAAAAVLLLGFFITQQFGEPVYGDYANYGTISLAVRGNQNELLSKAEASFNAKNYKESANYFTELLMADGGNTELQLYKAVSLVELNKFDEADALFGSISTSNSVYKDKAHWYLALSKLKQKDFKGCKNSLKAISVDADDYKKAQKLLNKLD